jgi:ferredoxin--NADP+ reductase
MKAISNITMKKQIKTMVSLKPIMLDGVGMCGSCRISVNRETKFACVDGPVFDAHSLCWQEIMLRQELFKDLEKVSVSKFEHNKECKCHEE